MTKIIYEAVEHDGGWAYQVDGVFSELFRPMTRLEERRNARRRNKSFLTT
jgi:hypothetical protein